MCYVRADFSIVRSVKSCPDCPEMYTDQFYEMQLTAIFIIAVYAIILPILFFYLLFKERANIRDERETPATRALAFLHSPYKPEFWFFEAVEMGRKLFLVGFAVFFPPGSLLQIIWALNVAISIIAIEVQVRPFRYLADSYCSLVASLATIFVLLMCAVLRTGTIVQELKQTDVVQRSVWKFLEFDLPQTLTIMFTSSILVFATVFYFMMKSLREQKTLPRVRHKSGRQAQLKKLMQRKSADGETLDTLQHAFLSHVWVTGQDQVRVIKSLLREVLPGIKVFLDVDDLNDISRLEEEIASSQKTLVFVSKGYFSSKNCLRELVRALDCEAEDKSAVNNDRGSIIGKLAKASMATFNDPLAAMRVVFICESELNKGSLTEAQGLEELRRSKRKGELKWQKYLKLLQKAHDDERELPEWEGWPLPVADTDEDNERFDWISSEISRKFREGAIAWYRVKAFQQISLLQIAEHFITPLAGDPAFIPGGPLAEKVKLPPDVPADGFHVYVSPNNAGALDFVYQELRHQFNGQLQIAYSQERIRDFYEAQEKIRERMISGGGMTSRMNTPRLVELAKNAQSVASGKASLDDIKNGLTSYRARVSPAATPRTPRPGKLARQSTQALMMSGGDTARSTSSSVSSSGEFSSARGRGACVFLLYLDGRTWTSSHSAELKEEVLAQLRAAKQSGANPAILLLHERDSTSPSHFPVEFADFFATTPNELITNNLYQPIAIALNEGRHRERSLRDAANELIRLFHDSHLMAGMESRWVTKHHKAPVFALAQHMREVGGVRWYDAPIKKKDEDLMRECLNYDLLDGVDDDTETLIISPVVVFEGSKNKERHDARQMRANRGAFSVHDEGRRLTIIYKPHAQGGRKVRVDGVPRGVRWSRRVEYSLEEKKEILENKGKSKAIDKTHWVEWKPEELTDAVIKRVDEEVGGIIVVERESRTVGADGTRAKINYQFDNPEGVASRLAVLAETLGIDALSGKGVGVRAQGTADRLGDQLKEMEVSLEKEPQQAGERSEFASVELASQPHEVPISVVRDVRNARALWRDKGAERARDKAKSPPDPAISLNGGMLALKGANKLLGGLRKNSEAPLGAGLDLKVKSREELRRDAANQRGSTGARTTESIGLDKSSFFTRRDQRQQRAICFTQRDKSSSTVSGSSSSDPSSPAAADSAAAIRALNRERMMSRVGRKKVQDDAGVDAPTRKAFNAAARPVLLRQPSHLGDEMTQQVKSRNSSSDEACKAGISKERAGRVRTKRGEAAEADQRGLIMAMQRRCSADDEPTRSSTTSVATNPMSGPAARQIIMGPAAAVAAGVGLAKSGSSKALGLARRGSAKALGMLAERPVQDDRLDA